MDFYKQHANDLLTLQSNEAHEDIGIEQPDPKMYFNHAVPNRTLDGPVSVAFPSRSFTYADRDFGLVRDFIVLLRQQKDSVVQHKATKLIPGTNKQRIYQ